MKTKNSFDTTVEMIKKADCLFLSNFNGQLVAGQPFNIKTCKTWAITMFSSIEEALECKYPLICSRKDKKLIKFLEENRKKNV